MKEFTVERKIPGGKLVRVHISVDSGKIISASIHGDFFIHPEQCIDEIEKSLIDSELTPDDIMTRLRGIQVASGFEIIGFDIDSLADMIMQAYDCPEAGTGQ